MIATPRQKTERRRSELGHKCAESTGDLTAVTLDGGLPLPSVTPGSSNQGRYAEAEPLYERSQAIREKILGPEHPDVATSLNNRAILLQRQVRAEREC